METSIALPDSYSSLPFKDISISHVPASLPTPSQVILLKLNRPQKFNAATERMIEEVVTAYEYFNADDRVKAIVVTGTGRAFCVGADLEIGFSKLLNKLDRVAAGFGITITLPATIRIACSSAKISFAFARRGLVMEAASSYFLPRLVGMSRALRLVTTGATYIASDPLLSQLFSELLPTPEETVARALIIATEITAQTSTVSTKIMRDMMYRGPSTAEEAHLLDSKIFLEMLRSKDSEEGMKSFTQKREPEFKGTMKDDAPHGWPWWKTLPVTNQESREQRINKM
ncbi:Enoyl- hydratase isomerase protein [Rutstroemia sp. NJR-2017a BVV2]|nr:Enoyl- hydratase isomerase protein [Rutstroemia sp. NJR-2017a BVV2]